ncbi:iron ABC transporter permease [Aggregatilineales bacterium SYSU G02658]
MAERVAARDWGLGMRSWALLAAPLMFLGVFFALPVVNLVVYSFTEAAGHTALPPLDTIIRVVLFTLGQALLSTLLTVGLALPVAYVFVRYQFFGRRLLLSLASLPFVLPTVVVAIAFRALLGRTGVVNAVLQQAFGFEQPLLQVDQSLALILLAHIFFNLALVVRMVTGYWVNLSPRLEEAGHVLGAGGWRLWLHVRWPLLRPVITAAALLVFIYTFTSFGVVLILGGLSFATLEVQIYFYAMSLFNLPGAAILSLVQLSVLALSIVVYLRLRRSLVIDLVQASGTGRPVRTWRDRLLVGGVCGALVAFLGGPLLALVWLSLTFRMSTPSLRYYELLLVNPPSVLFTSPWMSIVYSLMFGLMTITLALIMGGLAVWGLRRLRRSSAVVDWLLMLPMGVSAVTLGFGYLLTFNSPPLLLLGSWILIPIAHTMAALPLVIRVLLPVVLAVNAQLLEAAQMLGAGAWQRLRFVWLPLVSRGFALAAVFAFNVSLGEFGASAFIVRPNTATIPTTIFRLLGQPRPDQYGQALAMSVILLLVCLLSFLAIERLRDFGGGEY